MRTLEGQSRSLVMWPYKDLPGKPSKGRHFPLGFAVTLGLLRKASLLDPDGKRASLMLANPTESELGEGIVAEYRRPAVLRLMSLPEGEVAGAELWQWVIAVCRLLHERPLRANSGRGPYYVFLGPSRPPRVVERWVHFQTRGYRGTDKFTGGADRRLRRVDEWPVEVPPAVSEHG
jgi:hypothetical protein